MIAGLIFAGFLAAACWPAYSDLYARRDDVRRAMRGKESDDDTP
jgi:hypothetical protein